MNAFAFTVIFLAAVACTTAIKLWLGARHLAHVRAHRAAVPAQFTGQISLEAHQRLHGDEPGLAALWNFDDPENPARDATVHGFDGRLMFDAAAVPGSLPENRRQLPLLLAVTGRVTDPHGRAAGQATATLRERGAAEDLQAGPPLAVGTTDFSGAFSFLHRDPMDRGARPDLYPAEPGIHVGG